MSEKEEDRSKYVREEVLQLIEQKEKIEEEIKQLQEILKKNNVGMDDPLVDDEGFPLASVDVYQVRHARHMICYKQNDYKELMQKIEQGICEYYQSPQTCGPANAVAKNQASVTGSEPVTHKKEEHLVPFASVNIVHGGSPADSAGIKQGDLIVEFGSVNATNFRSVEDIGTIVHHSHGNAINVKLKRGGRIIHVKILPREWSGRGLLGCNVIPL